MYHHQLRMKKLLNYDTPVIIRQPNFSDTKIWGGKCALELMKYNLFVSKIQALDIKSSYLPMAHNRLSVIYVK